VAHHVEMAVSQRIEGSGIKCDSRHKLGSNPPLKAPQGRALLALNLFPGPRDPRLKGGVSKCAYL
jgi:hypothetical protein